MLPSTYTCLPLARYWPQLSPCFPQTTMLCHSVLSCRLPSASFQTSEVAMEKRATALPLAVKRTSGSLPRLPIRIALLTDIKSPQKQYRTTLTPGNSLVNEKSRLFRADRLYCFSPPRRFKLITFSSFFFKLFLF